MILSLCYMPNGVASANDSVKNYLLIMYLQLTEQLRCAL